MIDFVALQPHHRPAIERLLAATQLLGDPLPFRLAEAPVFDAFSLDWYFDRGLPDGLVAIEDGTVVGYCLVCCHPDDHRRWVRRRATRTGATLLVAGARGRLDRPSRRFYRLRLRDALHLARTQDLTAGGGHAHINVLRGVRDGRLTRRFRDHVDERCRRAGLATWHGEMNARDGRRAESLQRVAGDVVGRHHNHTLSALLGETVVRLTFRREVPSQPR